MKNKTIFSTALLAFLFSGQALAKCEFQRDIDQVLSLSDVELIKISVNAGDLEVHGHKSSNEILIKGRACASTAGRLDEIQLQAEQQGNQAEIKTLMPNTKNSSWFGKNAYAFVDLEIMLPKTIALEVSDSSGDLSISHVATLSLEDSSGDLEIAHVSGDLTVDDSSGGIDIEHVLGSVSVSDSSGGIDISDVGKNVLIRADSSGDIYIKNVKAGVHIKRDSSGSIYVKDIGGDFRVDRDGSGGITHKNIGGKIELPTED